MTGRYDRPERFYDRWSPSGQGCFPELGLFAVAAVCAALWQIGRNRG